MLPLPPARREAHEVLAIGARVHHPARGAGTIKAILADGRRVISFDSSAASRRYSVHALHKLTSGETRAIQARMLQIDWLRKVSPLYLPYISPISPYFFPISPLNPPCTSPISPQGVGPGDDACEGCHRREC